MKVQMQDYWMTFVKVFSRYAKKVRQIHQNSSSMNENNPTVPNRKTDTALLRTADKLKDGFYTDNFLKGLPSSQT